MGSAYALIGALLLVCSGSVIADNSVMGNAYRVDAEQRFENVPIGAKPLPARARSRSGLFSARMLHESIASPALDAQPQLLARAFAHTAFINQASLIGASLVCGITAAKVSVRSRLHSC